MNSAWEKFAKRRPSGKPCQWLPAFEWSPPQHTRGERRFTSKWHLLENNSDVLTAPNLLQQPSTHSLDFMTFSRLWARAKFVKMSEIVMTAALSDISKNSKRFYSAKFARKYSKTITYMYISMWNLYFIVKGRDVWGMQYNFWCNSSFCVGASRLARSYLTLEYIRTESIGANCFHAPNER